MKLVRISMLAAVSLSLVSAGCGYVATSPQAADDRNVGADPADGSARGLARTTPRDAPRDDAPPRRRDVDRRQRGVSQRSPDRVRGAARGVRGRTRRVRLHRWR